MSRSFFPMFSSRSVMVSGLTFKCLTHFELVFLSGIGQGSDFILLHVNIQFPQHHLPFSSLWILDLPVKYQLTIYAWIFFWALDSVPLVNMSVFMLIPYCFAYYCIVINFEFRKCDASSFVLSQDCFGYLGSFVVPHTFQDQFFYFL